MIRRWGTAEIDAAKEILRRYTSVADALPELTTVLRFYVTQPGMRAAFLRNDEKLPPSSYLNQAPLLKTRQERIDSDFVALKPEDFDTSVGNDGRYDEKAAKERRQEYSKSMGEYSQQLRETGGDLDLMPEKLGSYIGGLSEQERRFGNRKLARSVSLAAAHDALALRQFKQAAVQYLSGKVTPTGYAVKTCDKTLPRSVVLLLSDLHFGSDLSARDNPVAFGAVEEARRFEYVVRETLDFKPEYRANTELRLLLNGDLIEGLLMHTLRDGAPLVEQKLAFWKYLSAAIGLFAQQFPRVIVDAQSGNHERCLTRSLGRKTSNKADGHGYEMYWALAQMCAALQNVTFNIPYCAVSIVDLQGHKMLLSHGDTEVKLGDPDARAEHNALVLDRINSTQLYGTTFEVAAFGHFHKARYQSRSIRVIWNGALVPPNGHARTQGYIGERCGQWVWEAVSGYPVGDLRFLDVGVSQDRDEKLGTLIKPFRFDLE